MDDLVNNLATAFHVSGDSFSSNAAIGHPHFSNYKNRGLAAEKQEQRRREFLDHQKTKRSTALALVRHLDVDIAEGEDEDEDAIQVDTEREAEEGTSDSGETAAHRRKWREVNPFQNQLMCSEWLIHVPENMADKWIMVPCPEGKRVLVVAMKGLTKAYAKNGRLLKEFSSTLPGGCKDVANRKAKSTVLDCVFCQEQSAYYCLDIICWNGCPVFDSETEFRFYWLESKLTENPSLSVKNMNRHIFKALPRCACIKSEMERFLALEFPFKLDGLLFYHKATHYMAGQTPLVGWLKPFMLPEILGVNVPAELMVGYESVTSKSFMDEFNDAYVSKHGGRQYGGKKQESATTTPGVNECALELMKS